MIIIMHSCSYLARLNIYDDPQAHIAAVAVLLW